MDILSWNIAGIRASLKRDDFEFLKTSSYDVVCIQETKATTEQGEKALPEYIKHLYPYRYWNSTQGITQRRGFSGTCIWSKKAPINAISPPDFDLEGRITIVEFENYIVLTVYTPNSQDIESPRCLYRKEWDLKFLEFINTLNMIKPTILCGDFNVARDNIDIHTKRVSGLTTVGFLNSERELLHKYLKNFTDIFREKNPDVIKYTYWDQRNPRLRENNKGWRIDYFLVSNKFDNTLFETEIHNEIYGSDHCPISLKYNET